MAFHHSPTAWNTAALLAILAGSLLLAPLGQAQTEVSGSSTTTFNRVSYETCFPHVVTVIEAGCANWWVDSPGLMSPGRTGSQTSPTSCMAYTGYPNCYAISVTVSTTTNPLVGLTITSGGSSYGGCHVVGGSAPTGTAVLQTVHRIFFVGVDEGSSYCGGTLLLTLQTTVGSTAIANVGGYFEFAIPYQDTLVRLCNASEFSTDTAHPDNANSLYAKRNPCTTPTINTVLSGTLGLTGTLTLNGIPDTQQEIQAIADALSAGLDVTICPESAPCYSIVDVADDTTDDGALTVPSSTVDIGNQTVVVPADINVESEQGLRGFFILAWLVALFVFLRLAKLLAAGVCTAGIGLTLLFGTDLLPWQILALAMLPLALWLEALVPERIYQRFFTGQVGTTRRGTKE